MNPTRRGPAPPARRRWLVPGIVGLGAVLLAGCTSSGHGSPPASASTAAPGASSTTTAGGADGAAGQGAAALQQAYINVVDKVRASVVRITTSAGLGSGVVYDTKGDIVTNDHVVLGASQLQVQLPSVSKPLPATLVGAYGPDDLAVVRVTGAPSLHPASFGDSNSLQVGDIVLAIGNPLGLESSVTNGIISATGRTVVEPQQPGSPQGTIANAIQTSAAINPGNSGGALVDLAGQVVGIPTLAAVDPQIGGAANGIGFAIPSNTVTDIAGQIIAHGHVVNSHRAELGITPEPVIDLLGRAAGIGVAAVTGGGPAAKAGIGPGDVITAVDGQATTTLSDLEKVLAQLAPGQRVPVRLVRSDGKPATVTVTLGTLPGNVGG